MAEAVKIKLVVLWAEELQFAAKALAHLREIQQTASGDEWGHAIAAALNACSVALANVEEDGIHLVVMSGPGLVSRAKKKDGG